MRPTTMGCHARGHPTEKQNSGKPWKRGSSNWQNMLLLLPTFYSHLILLSRNFHISSFTIFMKLYALSRTRAYITCNQRIEIANNGKLTENLSGSIENLFLLWHPIRISKNRSSILTILYVDCEGFSCIYEKFKGVKEGKTSRTVSRWNECLF